MHLDIYREILARTDVEDANVYRADEVACWPPGLLKRLLELGLLREIERSRTVWCDHCDRGCSVEPDVTVDPATGRLRGYHFCREPHHGGPVNFDEGAFRRFEFCLQGLARIVADSIGTQGTLTEVVAGRVFLIGTLPNSGGPLDVFLASGLRLPDAPTVIERAGRLLASPAPVLIVTHMPPPAFAWPGPVPTVLSLYELTRWNEDDRTIDLTALATVIRTLQPPTAQPPLCTQQPAREATDALTVAEHDILTALAAEPKQTLLLVELEAAAGYGKKAIRRAITRLVETGYAARPSGTHRKGTAITPAGLAFLAEAQ